MKEELSKFMQFRARCEDEACAAVQAAVRAFEEGTGLAVLAVDVDMIDMSDLERRRVVVGRVSFKIDL